MTPASAVRLDGASLDQWTPEKLGRHIGYMPQEVELFDGTVADNIARLDANAPSDAVVAAAQAAGAHDLIVRLRMAIRPAWAKAASRCPVANANALRSSRALYGNPFLVVLDEPNASLDAAGDTALTEAILSCSQTRRHRHRHRAPSDQRSPPATRFW